MELADLLVGAAVTIIGLYLTHSLRRQQRLKVAEQRMASYRELWKLMEIARPTRLEAWEAAGPLTRKEARGLYANMTHWYFGTGHGMLLTETTKKLYLQTKESLGRYAVGTGPDWQHAGRRAIQELSLLRQQMKLDLDIYGVSYSATLTTRRTRRSFATRASIHGAGPGHPGPDGWPQLSGEYLLTARSGRQLLAVGRRPRAPESTRRPARVSPST